MARKKNLFSEKTAERILKLLEAGLSKSEVAETLGISRRTLFHYLKKMYKDDRFHEKVKRFYEPSSKDDSEEKSENDENISDNKAMLTKAIEDLREETEKLTESISRHLVEPTVIPTQSNPLNIGGISRSEDSDPLSILKNLKEQLDKLQSIVKTFGEMQMKVGKSISEMSAQEVERAKKLLEDLGYVVIPREQYLKLTKDEAIRLLTREGYKIISPYVHIERDLPKILEDYKKQIEKKYKESETKEIFDLVKSIALGVVDALTRGDILSLMGNKQSDLGLANLGGFGGSGDRLFSLEESLKGGERGYIGDVEETTKRADNTNDSTIDVSVLSERPIGSGEAEYTTSTGNQVGPTRRWGIRGRVKKPSGDSEKSTS